MKNRFRDAMALVRALRLTTPVICYRPDAARRNAATILAAFPGPGAYAVKSCDDPAVLATLAAAGVRHWDIASVAEGVAARAVDPGAELHFMNPVKPRAAIAEAHGALGVRTFAFDCREELDKIVHETGNDPSVLPVLRLAVARDRAKLCLAGKFGAEGSDAVELLRAAATAGGHRRSGAITFHVGSQCEDPAAFHDATALALDVADAAGVALGFLDIGGGFPAAYQGTEPSFAVCAGHALTALHTRRPGFAGTLQCEPGRALSAPAASVVVRVEMRRVHRLFLNDGIFGNLAELRFLPGAHPLTLLRPDATPTDGEPAPLAPFDLFGPTCDSMDAMPGPYLLPADVREGDWIEVGQAGAYSTCFRTRFNGFNQSIVTAVIDERPGNRLGQSQGGRADGLPTARPAERHRDAFAKAA